MSQIPEQACEILQLTHDGNDLDPRDLSLLQSAVNDDLNDRGLKAFADLLKQVKAGKYAGWYFGIEHLKLRNDGYVTWKGNIVEHFSHHGPGGNYGESARKSAEHVVADCKRLESLGKPTTMGTVGWGVE